MWVDELIHLTHQPVMS